MEIPRNMFYLNSRDINNTNLKNFEANPCPPPKKEEIKRMDPPELSVTGDSQRDSRESIRANHSQLKTLFL